ncbi:MAG: glutamyl-tRNA reductase [Verrucomicrobiae bacterium]|nr:glutamyl-tRNA reductase [Verrucomicrobiae bacterium]MCP5539961.1 glutamyl-tRNA reductase [Akkermansiaceae bacterium]MCP5549894.1 glutamyl-tRNA reductase [Akkermansiaceae bacterium]
MSILCLGVNHKTAPVEIRERLAFPESEIDDRLREIRDLPGVDETVVLSTCNRVEIYAASPVTETAFEALIRYLIDHFRLPARDAVDFYHLKGEAAALHLFRVASGLDSMVLGETEIFGQVKKAYALAQEAGSTARRMNKLFQQSFQVGKLIRSNTRIQLGATSVGSVAVDLAEKIFGNLRNCRVMVIGAGEMSRQTAQSLVSRGASSLIVSNRSYDKAVELADELAGEAVRFDEWEQAMSGVDIVISSTSAPHAVIVPDMVAKVMRHRGDRALFLIDIAVPRDIEPAVNRIENVYLYDIDDLERIAEVARVEREKQISLCETIIEKHIEEKGIEALSPDRRPGDEGTGRAASPAGDPAPQS